MRVLCRALLLSARGSRNLKCLSAARRAVVGLWTRDGDGQKPASRRDPRGTELPHVAAPVRYLLSRGTFAALVY